jgi:hypothetical protein
LWPRNMEMGNSRLQNLSHSTTALLVISKNEPPTEVAWVDGPEPTPGNHGKYLIPRSNQGLWVQI